METGIRAARIKNRACPQKSPGGQEEELQQLGLPSVPERLTQPLDGAAKRGKVATQVQGAGADSDQRCPARPKDRKSPIRLTLDRSEPQIIRIQFTNHNLTHRRQEGENVHNSTTGICPFRFLCARSSRSGRAPQVREALYSSSN